MIFRFQFQANAFAKKQPRTRAHTHTQRAFDSLTGMAAGLLPLWFDLVYLQIVGTYLPTAFPQQQHLKIQKNAVFITCSRNLSFDIQPTTNKSNPYSLTVLRIGKVVGTKAQRCGTRRTLKALALPFLALILPLLTTLACQQNQHRQTQRFLNHCGRVLVLICQDQQVFPCSTSQETIETYNGMQ